MPRLGAAPSPGMVRAMWKPMGAALALGIVTAAAMPARADVGYSVLDTFPAGDGLHVEAAVLVKDARALGA